MSFCNTLRRRSSCSSLIPVLLSPSGLSLREGELKTHDLAVSIQTSPDSSTRSLRVIILTQSSITPGNIGSTISRLQHFESLTGGTDSVILFPLFPLLPSQGATSASSNKSPPFPTPLHALAQAQLVLVDQSINIPILPLSTSSSLPKIINSFITSLNASLAVSAASKTVNAAIDVLPYATSNGSMSPEMHIAMTDVFSSMRDVAGMGEGEETKKRLVQQGLRDDEADDCMKFWVEEWICE